MDAKTFENLPEEKKQAILSAGILCFGRSGYDKTSISEIAKEAGISKPAVFHYFGTKQDLFLYLIKYVRKELEAVLIEGTEDYFESLELYIKMQFQLVKKHPGMYEFMRLNNEPEEIDSFEAIDQFISEYTKNDVDKVFAHVDWTKFRDDLDRTTILNMTTWVGNGCLTQLEKTLPPNDIFKEMTRYLTILKTTLYKAEYL